VALTHEWFDKIKDGVKCTELRANSFHWKKRLADATHIDLRRGLDVVIAFEIASSLSNAKTRTPPTGYQEENRLVKRIRRTQEVDACRSEEFGGPVYNSDEHKKLFKKHERIIVLHLEAGSAAIRHV
jgi:hypothetical protein